MVWFQLQIGLMVCYVSTGYALPRTVYHGEAAIWQKAATHGLLWRRSAGRTAGTGELLCERSKVGKSHLCNIVLPRLRWQETLGVTVAVHHWINLVNTKCPAQWLIDNALDKFELSSFVIKSLFWMVQAVSCWRWHLFPLLFLHLVRPLISHE